MDEQMFKIVMDPENPGIDELVEAYKGAHSNTRLFAIHFRTTDPLHPRIHMILKGMRYANNVSDSDHLIIGLVLLNNNSCTASGCYNTQTKQGSITVNVKP